MATLTLAICARNAQDIIGECLKSIQEQTVAPDEVLVAVDDPSDPTTAVAESFGARVLASYATGLYEARNAVLEECTTDYLAFTDADCVLVPGWVSAAKEVLDSHPDVAAGTGRHPPIGKKNLASWLHHMWYVVEATHTGETSGVIGGNSYFRTACLREVGGWLRLPRHSAAEDVYISGALRQAGYKIWFDERVAAQHNYETRLTGLWKKSVMMGKDIVVMMRASRWRGGMWWYTLVIPLLPASFLAGLACAYPLPQVAAALWAVPMLGSYLYLAARFRNPVVAFPRWVARWILVWPYSWGILKGIVAPIPEGASPGPPLDKPDAGGE